MKVNKVYKIVRPMRKFGNLIKDILYPQRLTESLKEIKDESK
jgi:hypothetical protein